MLTPDERTYLEVEIAETVMVDPRRMLMAAVHPDLRLQFPGGDSANSLIPATLDLLIKDQWNHAPPALVKFLSALLPDDARAVDIAQRLAVVPPAAADPFGALIFDTRRPFFARREVRDFMRDLKKPRPTRPVVIILGQTQSGKSYTYEFVDYLRRKDQLEHVYIRAERGRSVDMLDLARDLIVAVGGTKADLPPQMTNTVKWAEELASAIVQVANKNAWWFVFDGFTPAMVNEDTRLLIAKFATALNVGLAMRLHRLVLIDFDRSLLSLQPGTIAIDNTAPIAHAEVRRAIAELLRAASEVEVDQFLSELIRGLPDPVSDVTELSARFDILVETSHT